MSDEQAPAPAPAPQEVPINTDQVHVPEPTGRSDFGKDQQPPEPQEDAKAEKPEEPKEKEEKKPSESVDKALRKALAKERAEAKEKAEAETLKAEKPEKPEPKAEKKPAEPAPEDAAKQAEQEQAQTPAPDAPKTDGDGPDHNRAPDRFHQSAKAEWEAAPESVRAETHRAIAELTKGHEQYKQAYEPFREFSELARQHNIDAKAQLSEYVGIAQLLQRDLAQGLDVICRNAGTSLDQVVKHLSGQTPDEARSRDTQVINQLRQQVSGLQQQLQQVSGTMQQQKQAQISGQINEFAKSHPRFDELSGEIAKQLKTGYATTLEEAYANAERLKPASSSAPAAPAVQTRQTTPLNPAGQKSIKGSSPAPGAVKTGTVQKKGPAPSINEALQKALKQAS